MIRFGTIFLCALAAAAQSAPAPSAEEKTAILQATREHYGHRVFQQMAGYLSKQDFESSRNKIRTAPLWGVRLRPRLMHDGTSLTLLEAITRHRGEACQ